MSRLLVVEDQPTFLDSLRRGLEEEGYQIITAGSLADARRILATSTVDCILLDRMLPDGEGLTLLRELRQQGSQLPVLILTARDAIEDRIAGLDSGADDYLLKPFAFDEFLARLRAVLRRTTSQHGRVLKVDDLELDVSSRLARRGGRKIELTQRQFELLAYLMQMAGQTVSRQQIAENVWKEATVTWTNVIEVQINHLRRRIEQPGSRVLLHTVRGEGYCMEARP